MSGFGEAARSRNRYSSSMPSLLVAKANGELVLRVDLAPRQKVTIGRSPRCDLVLSAPSISRHHALLFEHGGEWWLVDTGSRTGVQGLEGPVRQVRLDPDHWCQIGPAFLWLMEPAPPHPAPPELAGIAVPPVALRGELIELWRRGPSIEPSNSVIRDGDDLPGPRLVVVDDDYALIRRVSLRRRERLTIGSDPACDLCIDDVELAPVHCVLFREGRHWAVADAGARGGLRVDGAVVERRRLRPCMPVHVGRRRFFIDPVAFVEREEEDEPLIPPVDAVSTEGLEPMTAAVSAFIDPEEVNGSTDGTSTPSGRLREPAWPVVDAARPTAGPRCGLPPNI